MKNQLSVPLKELEEFGTDANYKLYGKHTAKSLAAIGLEIEAITKAMANLFFSVLKKKKPTFECK